MKRILSFTALMGIVLTSCQHPNKPKTSNLDSLPTKPDTVVVAYADKGTYNLTRALRIISKQPKITDSTGKKWDWAIDTSYVVEMVNTPLDTLKDSLKHPRYDPINHLPILRKSFTIKVGSPLPAYFWILEPHIK